MNRKRKNQSVEPEVSKKAKLEFNPPELKNSIDTGRELRSKKKYNINEDLPLNEEPEQPEEEIESHKSISIGPEFDPENHEFVDREEDEGSFEEIMFISIIAKDRKDLKM